jgi:hypothetical protein
MSKFRSSGSPNPPTRPRLVVRLRFKHLALICENMTILRSVSVSFGMRGNSKVLGSCELAVDMSLDLHMTTSLKGIGLKSGMDEVVGNNS